MIENNRAFCTWRIEAIPRISGHKFFDKFPPSFGVNSLKMREIVVLGQFTVNSMLLPRSNAFNHLQLVLFVSIVKIYFTFWKISSLSRITFFPLKVSDTTMANPKKIYKTHQPSKKTHQKIFETWNNKKNTKIKRKREAQLSRNLWNKVHWKGRWIVSVALLGWGDL